MNSAAFSVGQYIAKLKNSICIESKVIDRLQGIVYTKVLIVVGTLKQGGENESDTDA